MGYSQKSKSETCLRYYIQAALSHRNARPDKAPPCRHLPVSTSAFFLIPTDLASQLEGPSFTGSSPIFPFRSRFGIQLVTSLLALPVLARVAARLEQSLLFDTSERRGSTRTVAGAYLGCQHVRCSLLGIRNSK